jgi:4-amino-4-deoxy-L-arabinose transferase-like glycosyltransferase
MPRIWRRYAVPIIVAAGCLLRLHGVDRPLDFRSLSLWHEADYTEIARNFAREDLDPLEPRIDWRGDSSGKVEMELPVLPWLAALARRALGADERVMRALSAAASLGALLLFARLAGRVLPAAGAGFATACFALSPLAVYLATRMQPEAAMVLLEILAASALWRWYEAPATGRLLAAAAALAAAMLIKEPATLLGLTFAWLVWRRLGWRALRDWRVYLAAAIALAPAIAWYAWAYHFWTVDGNSLGLSDEAHLVGPDVLLRRGLLGNARVEIGEVLTPLGAVLAAAGWREARHRLEPAVAWYVSALLFEVAAGRTAGASWAFYYHCLAVAPACLLMGAGARAVTERAAGGERRRAAGGDASGDDDVHMAAGRTGGLGALLCAAVLASLALVTGWMLARRDGVIGAASTGVGETRDRALCAAQFKPLIPAQGRIAVSGLDGSDAAGHRIAFNDPTFFAFADRKGFVYERRDASLATLEALRRRGARYWIVAESDLARKTLGRAAVDRSFQRLAACPGGYALYDLTRRPAGSAAASATAPPPG